MSKLFCLHTASTMLARSIMGWQPLANMGWLVKTLYYYLPVQRW